MTRFRGITPDHPLAEGRPAQTIDDDVAALARLLQASQGIRDIVAAAGLEKAFIDSLRAGFDVGSYQSHGNRVGSGSADGSIRRRGGGDLGIGRWSLVGDEQQPAPASGDSRPEYGILGPKQLPGGHSGANDPDTENDAGWGQYARGDEPPAGNQPGTWQAGQDMTVFQGQATPGSPGAPESWDRGNTQPRFLGPQGMDGSVLDGPLPPGDRRWEDSDGDDIPNYRDWDWEEDVDPSTSGGGGMGATLLRMLGRADLLNWGATKKRRPLEIRPDPNAAPPSGGNFEMYRGLRRGWADEPEPGQKTGQRIRRRRPEDPDWRSGAFMTDAGGATRRGVASSFAAGLGRALDALGGWTR